MMVIHLNASRYFTLRSTDTNVRTSASSVVAEPAGVRSIVRFRIQIHHDCIPIPPIATRCLRLDATGLPSSQRTPCPTSIHHWPA